MTSPLNHFDALGRNALQRLAHCRSSLNTPDGLSHAAAAGPPSLHVPRVNTVEPADVLQPLSDHSAAMSVTMKTRLGKNVTYDLFFKSGAAHTARPNQVAVFYELDKVIQNGQPWIFRQPPKAYGQVEGIPRVTRHSTDTRPSPRYHVVRNGQSKLLPRTPQSIENLNLEVTQALGRQGQRLLLEA
jgi:hypothetical protein